MIDTIVDNHIISELQHTPESNESQDESLLEQEITSLWSEHVRAQTSQRATSKELRLIRTALAERLHGMKALLSRPGRGGQWSNWLKDRNIPRSTADRLVSRHEEAQSDSPSNMPSDPITPEEKVERLVQSLLPRLRRALATDEEAYRFVCALAKEFNLNHTVGDNGIMLVQPSSDEQPASELFLDNGRGLEMVGHGVS